MESSFTLPFELPENWHLYTVDQLIKENIIEKPLDGNHGGIHPKSSDYVDQGVPFIMASDLENGRVNLKNCKFITEEQAKTLRKGFSKIGDVLISHKATIGRTAIVQDCEYDFIVLTPQVTYYRVKDDKRLNNRYLKFYFDSWFFQQILGSWAGAGSTRAYLGITGQMKLPVIIPPHDVQIEIAKSIGALDDKIELNRQINQTLEQIAQAIFKSWFVNFEPVKAKIQAKENGQDPERAAMCTISGKNEEELGQLSTEQLQQLATTAALFPDDLAESELGEIPKGWGNKRIDQLLVLSYGKALKKTDRKPGRYPVYGSGGVTGVHEEYLVEGPGIIVGRKGTVGSLHWEDNNFYPIDTVFYVVPHEGFSLEYIYYLLGTLGLEGMNTDAAVPGLNRNNVYRLMVAGHPEELVKEFSNIVHSFSEKISLTIKETNSLSVIRDTLLPKLLSGDLPVNQFEQ